METKYYKFISEDSVIVDAVDKLKYLRYIQKFDKLLSTDKGSSDGVIGSDKKTVYLWVGKNCPPNKPWKHIEIREITKAEYNLIKSKLYNNEVLIESTKTLITCRAQKVKEFSQICHDTIIDGVSVLFTDGKYHHFKMTNEDQLNLLQIENQIKNGEQLFLYHETACECKLYQLDDMKLLIQAVNKHRMYQTTYYNFIKNCINQMTNINEIEQIQYGELSFLTPAQKDILRNYK